MAGSKKCKRNNVNKQPKVAQLPNRLGVQCEKDPDNFYDIVPRCREDDQEYSA